MVYGHKKHNAIQSKTPEEKKNLIKEKAKQRIRMCVEDKSYVTTLKKPPAGILLFRIALGNYFQRLAACEKGTK